MSDAAPLICLAQVDGLPWLRRIFGHIELTRQVRDEVLTGSGKPGEDALSEALNDRLLRMHSEWNWPEPRFANLGEGEASCLCAAVNLIKRGHECLLLIDDREARRAASLLGIGVTGTAAVVGAAKGAGLIASAGAKFAELRQKGFRISDAIIQSILESVGEEVGPTPRGKKANRPGPKQSAKKPTSASRKLKSSRGPRG